MQYSTSHGYSHDFISPTLALVISRRFSTAASVMMLSSNVTPHLVFVGKVDTKLSLRCQHRAASASDGTFQCVFVPASVSYGRTVVGGYFYCRLYRVRSVEVEVANPEASEVPGHLQRALQRFSLRVRS